MEAGLTTTVREGFRTVVPFAPSVDGRAKDGQGSIMGDRVNERVAASWHAEALRRPKAQRIGWAGCARWVFLSQIEANTTL